MDYIRHWWRRPRKIFLRRAIFQIHLWTGIALGLYAKRAAFRWPVARPEFGPTGAVA